MTRFRIFIALLILLSLSGLGNRSARAQEAADPEASGEAAVSSATASSAAPAESAKSAESAESDDLPSWKTRKLSMQMGSVPTKAASLNLQQRVEYKLFKEFEEQFPNVEFESNTPIQFIGIEGGSSNRLLLEMASRTAPAIIGYPVKAFDNYADQGFMLPLNRFVERDEFAWVRDHLEKYQILTDVLTRPDPETGEPILYAIPTAVRTMGIHYRKDMFRAAGVSHPPETWDEFRATLEAIRDEEEGTYGWAIHNHGTAVAWWFINFIWQSGSEVIENTPEGPRAAFANPEGARALDFLRDLVHDDLVLRTSDYGDYFTRGKVAMLFSYVGSEAQLPDEGANVDPMLLGVAPLPRGPDGDYGAEINGAMVSINAQVEDPDLQEIAFRYMIHGLKPESRKLMMREYAEVGLAKYFTTEALEEVGLEEFTDQVSPEWDRAAAEILETARPEPHGPKVRLIYEIMGNYIDRALDPTNRNVPSLTILQECADDFNQRLGAVPPEIQQTRKRNVGIILAVGLIVWAAFIYYSGKMLSGALGVKKGQALDLDTPKRKRPRRWKVALSAWAFMLPALFLILIWSYYPLLKGSVMAFQDYQIIRESTFNGLENFVDIIYGNTFMTSLYYTVLYALVSMALGFFVPIFLAIALDEIPRFKRLFRTVYYLPAVTTGLVIMFLWKWFYEGTEEGLVNRVIDSFAGLVDSIWMFFGGDSVLIGDVRAIDWLGEPILFLGIPVPMIAVILPGIWAHAGPGCLIYLAALKSVPNELYEAAEVDGAGFIRKIFNITIPMLLPLILINFIGAFVGTFQAMGNILVMTGGGPLMMTHVVGLEIWYAAFMRLEFGYATAVAWVVGSLLIGFTIFKLNILRKAQFRAAHKVEI